MPTQLVELYIDQVIDFSSQYGSEKGSAYTINKIIGRYNIYPIERDSSDAAVFRTYGKFWNNSISCIKDIQSHHISNYSSEDYLEVTIKFPLIIEKIDIFETYYPGSVERIFILTPRGWINVWKKTPNQFQEQSFKARIFSPEISKLPYSCDTIRVEVNQSNKMYYSEFDAIKISGYKLETKNSSITSVDTNITNDCHFTSSTDSENTNENNSYLNNNHKDNNTYNQSRSDSESISDDEILIEQHNQFKDYISYLPEEILIKIFGYFPLKTLSKIACVSKRFETSVKQALRDINQLNLRSVWNRLDHQSLIWLGNNCPNLARIDLSWCGKNRNFNVFGLCHFMYLIGRNMTTLRLSSCQFVNDGAIRSIAKNCIVLNELDLSSCVNIPEDAFGELGYLTELMNVNLYRTSINNESMCHLLYSWTKLKHLNVGSCNNLTQWSYIVDVIVERCRSLQTIDLWRSEIDNMSVLKLNSSGLKLRELDLGWCKKISSDSGFIKTIATNMNKGLIKLCLTSNRSVIDSDLVALADNCPMLEQLDVLGALFITTGAIEYVLDNCRNLKMFDISFACKVEEHQLKTWCHKYPNCGVLVSYYHQMYPIQK